MTLGQKIKALRLDKALSQPELAALAGIEQSYLSKLENDKSIPSNDMFNALLAALECDLESLLADPSLKNDYVRLRQIPDVDVWLRKQGIKQQAGQRAYLYLCSLLVVVAVTLFYMGQTRQPFSETMYEYESDGVVLEGEHKDIFRHWRRLIDHNADNYREAIQQKELEMSRRVDQQYVLSDVDMGPQFEQKVEGGMRFYRLNKEKQQHRAINDWLRVTGVFLLCSGLLGFVLERRIYRLSH